MAKVEFTTGQDPSKQLPKEWQDYQWAIDELRKHFKKVRWQLFHYDTDLTVIVGDKLSESKNRQAFFLKHEYHGPNAKAHNGVNENGELVIIYDEDDWQQYDLMTLDDPREALNQIIITIKSQFNLKQQGVF